MLVGYDPDDPATAWSGGNTEEDHTKFLKANGLQGKRIGVLRSFFGPAPINGEVNRIANQAVEDMKRSGTTVVELNTPDFDSEKLSTDVSVHLYEFKPAINAYLAAGNTPVKSTRRDHLFRQISSEHRKQHQESTRPRDKRRLSPASSEALRVAAACHKNHG